MIESSENGFDCNAIMTIAVAIINYCNFEDTTACVASLSRSKLAPAAVYVVDNASPDGSGSRLNALVVDRCEFHLEVILSEENLGFGGANNLVMRKAFAAGHDHVLILNNDTEVDPSMLGELYTAVTEDTVTVPLMLYHSRPDVVWYAGGYFSKWDVPRHEHMGEPLAGLQLKCHEVQWATGCCMLVSRDAFAITGGFDENLFLYWEDADWSIRLRRAGFRIVFVPEARLYHKVSASTGGEGSPLSYYYMTRNRLFAIDKLGLGKKLWLWSRLGLVRAVLSRKPQYAMTLEAWHDYRLGKMGRK